ncbi:MAG: carboxynorspermidine decarboxylase [Rikenellaceae bacterium]
MKKAVNNLWADVPSPCYVVSEEALLRNLAVIDRVREESGAEVIVALKASAMWSIFDLLAAHSDGATASSLAEAELVREKFGAGGALSHTYAPIYDPQEVERIVELSSHITFNSLSQYERFGALASQSGVSCGLRVNIGYSPVETDLYNPCVAGSRLGIAPAELSQLPEGVEGLHFHVLCESRPHHLRLALEALERNFGDMLPQLKWLNMGGGHLMTHEEYDCDELIALLKEFGAKYPHLRLILEPGSAFTWRTGELVTTVEDVVQSGGVTTAMINASFACHMPDCLEMPYKPTIVGACDPHDDGAEESKWRVGGNSCLAGDYIGDWVFEDGRAMPEIGERIVFEDMIHYTMVKTTMFNGVSHPSIAIRRVDGTLDVVRRFGYEDYKNRMS